MKMVDYRNLTCPAPVVETRRQLLAAPEEPLAVLVGDTMARDNVTRLAQTLGFGVETVEAEGGFSLSLTPGAQPDSCEVPAAPTAGPTVVYIGNDAMGGDEKELGRMLMVNFIGTLLEADPRPDRLIFINEGVRLTTTGSRVLEPLQKLAAAGVEIVSCGLCLDYFGLKEQLQVGRVGNMFDTVQAFTRAGRLIRP